jgi:hypothetical protein
MPERIILVVVGGGIGSVLSAWLGTDLMLIGAIIVARS